jgi:transposase
MNESVQTEAALPGLEMSGAGPAEGTPVELKQRGRARVKPLDRSQLLFQTVDVERLIEPEHPARGIWEFVGRLDLERFYAPIEAVEGVAGRQPWDPRLLISLWVYAYSRGISSARELARRCAYEPAFQWLAALGQVNYHTLADFRSSYDAALRELFVQVLGVLSAQGLVSLERVMHDGTKVKALASKSSFQREAGIEEHLEAARQQVEALKDWQGEETPRQRAAQERAARERHRRVEQALEELDKIRQTKKGAQAAASARVSHTDPQARVMKQPDGGFAPSYNVQLSTDAAHKIIVGAAVSQKGNDFGQLLPGVQQVQQNFHTKPKQVVADGGFTSRANIIGMAAQGIEFIGSLPELDADTAGQLEQRGIGKEFYPQAFTYDTLADTYRCPAGEILRHVGCKQREDKVEHSYRTEPGRCQACPFLVRCCGRQAEKGRLAACRT